LILDGRLGKWPAQAEEKKCKNKASAAEIDKVISPYLIGCIC